MAGKKFDNFKFYSIPKTPAAIAQRLSVFLPLIPGATAEDLIQETFTRHSINKLIRMWRGRVAELSRNRWDRLRGPTWARCMNCRPSMAFCYPANHPCHNHIICPFCWTRHVTRNCYHRFERGLFGTNVIPRTKKARQVAASVAVSNYHLFEYAVELCESADQISIRKLIAREQRLLTRHRGSFRYSFGTCYLTTVEAMDSDQEYWKTKRRVLSLIPADTKDRSLPPREDLETCRLRHESITRGVLAGAVGRACEYPAGMMTSPVRRTMEVLEYRCGDRGKTPRLLTFHGEIRNHRTYMQPTARDLNANDITGTAN